MVFALHAVVLSSLVWSMFAKRIWGLEQGAGQRVSGVTWAVVVGSLLAVVVATVFVAAAPGGGYDARGWAWIDVVYAVSYIKLVITVIKYIPQAYTNYKRKSTDGWSIEQLILDLVGGVLSVAQLVIDSLLEGGDWSGITGNPVKFGLGNITVVFDVIFILQHYVFYRNSRAEDTKGEVEDGERSRLLGGTEHER